VTERFDNLRLLLQAAGTADPWSFLLDFSTLLYALDKTGKLELDGLGEDTWRGFVYDCRAAVNWDLPQPPLARLNAGCAAQVRSLLEDLSASPEALHANACAVFDALSQQATALGFLEDFLTPPSLAGMMAELLDPQPGETVLDPACGSGRLLTAAHSRCADLALIGVEISAAPLAFARFNLYFHSAHNAALCHQDFLEPDARWEQMCGVVLSNPPYIEISTTLQYIRQILRALKPGGRCGLLVPEGFLTNTGGLRDVLELRRWILEEHTLEAVVSLPMKIYSPYTVSKSSLLMVRKGRQPGGRAVFFTRLPEYEGPESGFSDRVYQPDMARIAAAWRAYSKQGTLPQEGVMCWTATLEEIRSREYLFSADTYCPPQYTTPEAYQDYSLNRMIQAQAALEDLFRKYGGIGYEDSL